MKTDYYELMKDSKKNNTYISNIESANEIFKNQLESLQKIKGSVGYKNIKNFFKFQLNESIYELQNSNLDNAQELGRIQGMIKVSEKFLKYLDSAE